MKNAALISKLSDSKLNEPVMRGICDAMDEDGCDGPACPCWAMRRRQAKGAIDTLLKALEAEGENHG